MLLGDCIKGMQALPGGCIDIIVTDPPYMIGYKTDWRADKQHDFCSPIANDSNPELIREYMAACYRILKDSAAMYCFTSERKADLFKSEAANAGFRHVNTIIWEKGSHTAGDLKSAFGFQYEMILLLNKGRALLQGRRMGDVWHFPRVAGPNQLHQNQKPVDLIKRCIEYHSKPGDVVFDGFMGSGTTAVAAMQTRRKFIGFEIEPAYFNMTAERIKAAASAKGGQHGT